MKSIFTSSKALFLCILLFYSGSTCLSQIWSNTITGTDPGLVNPYTDGDVVGQNISVSGIGRGSGVVGNAAGNRYNANNWNSASLDLNDYFTFTITPTIASGSINFSSFAFFTQKSGTGPTNFEIRSSIDNFAASIPGSSVIIGNNSIDLTSSLFQNISNPIEFRIYGWGATATGGTFSINDFIFGATLPVTLLNQNLKLFGNYFNLLWTTIEETNNSHFTIDHSTDGKNFKELGRVESNKDRSGEKDYAFSHESPVSGINYYRLNQFDLDGKKTSYGILAGNFEGGKDKFLFPTKAVNEVWLAGHKDGKVQVFDATGRELLTQQYQAGSSIDVSNFQSGAYFLIIGQDKYTFIKY